LGWNWADPVVGLFITFTILGILRSAVRQVGARLMDAVDPALVDQATSTVSRVSGVRGIRELRIRWIGHTLRAEADITVDPDLSMSEAHELAHRTERDLLVHVRRLTAANVHVSPSGVHAARRRNDFFGSVLRVFE
jgi:divalent metal cation (Fe/Co/Zn/Cd) transporter